MSDHKMSRSRAMAIADVAEENSVSQARWVLVPLFALWLLFFVAGVIFQ